MAAIVCPSCNGRKHVNPLGGIIKNCAYCKGVGYTVEAASDATPSATTAQTCSNEAPKGDKRSKAYKQWKMQQQSASVQ